MCFFKLKHLWKEWTCFSAVETTAYAPPNRGTWSLLTVFEGIDGNLRMLMWQSYRYGSDWKPGLVAAHCYWCLKPGSDSWTLQEAAGRWQAAATSIQKLIDWPIRGVRAVAGGWLDPIDHSCPSVIPALIQPHQYKHARTACAQTAKRGKWKPHAVTYDIYSGAMSPFRCQQSLDDVTWTIFELSDTLPAKPIKDRCSLA